VIGEGLLATTVSLAIVTSGSDWGEARIARGDAKEIHLSGSVAPFPPRGNHNLRKKPGFKPPLFPTRE